MSEKLSKLSKYVTPSSVYNFCDENGRMLNKEVVKVLNEQQVTISALKEENEQLQKVCSYLKKENQSLIDNIFDIYEKVKWVGR